MKTNRCSAIDINCKRDAVGPEKPEIRVAIASAGIPKKGSKVVDVPPPPAVPARLDPAYLELGNWEPGAVIELVSTSNDPRGNFNDPRQVMRFDPTGENSAERIASLWLKPRQMKRFSLEAGEEFWVRFVDIHGVPGQAERGRLSGEDYGGARVTISEPGAKAPVSGERLSVLDGNKMKTVILKYLTDEYAPDTSFLKRRAKLETAKDGSVSLRAQKALEGEATVEVENTRTGEMHSTVVDADTRDFTLGLPGVKNGDPLRVTVSDVNGCLADPFFLVYGKSCKDGRAAVSPRLMRTLAGVIR
jgi:hypothetical protein